MIFLDPNQTKIVKEILKKHLHDQRVLVFGSRFKGDHKQHSDLDLCIMGPPLSLLELALLKESFSNSALPFLVDIVEWRNLTKEFQTLIHDSHEAINL